jgi:hypothetical protein
VGLRDLSLGLIEGGLKRAWIDFEENIVFVNEGAFAVILFYEIAGDLGLDVGVDRAIEGGDPVAVDGDVLLFDGDDDDVERRRSRLRLGITGATGHEQQGGQQKRRKDIQMLRPFSRIARRLIRIRF